MRVVQIPNVIKIGFHMITLLNCRETKVQSKSRGALVVLQNAPKMAKRVYMKHYVPFQTNILRLCAAFESNTSWIITRSFRNKENALCGDHVCPPICMSAPQYQSLNRWKDLSKIRHGRVSLKVVEEFWFSAILLHTKFHFGHTYGHKWTSSYKYVYHKPLIECYRQQTNLKNAKKTCWTVVYYIMYT